MLWKKKRLHAKNNLNQEIQNTWEMDTCVSFAMPGLRILCLPLWAHTRTNAAGPFCTELLGNEVDSSVPVPPLEVSLWDHIKEYEKKMYRWNEIAWADICGNEFTFGFLDMKEWCSLFIDFIKFELYSFSCALVVLYDKYFILKHCYSRTFPKQTHHDVDTLPKTFIISPVSNISQSP